MPSVQVGAGIEELTVEARIIRADGQVEDLGVVAHYQRPDRRKQLAAVAAVALVGALALALNKKR